MSQQESTTPDLTPSSAEARESLARLRWRCRRGMRELDVVLQRYLEQSYPHAPHAEQLAFEVLLEEQDPQLLAYLMGRELPSDKEQVNVVARLANPGV